MTLAAKIIQNAFREGNLIPIGKDPTAAESAEALDRLNAFMLGVYGQELGENLVDWDVPQPQRTAPVAANYPQLPYPLGSDATVMPVPISGDLSLNLFPYPPANSRIVFGSVACTVYFAEKPNDGARMAIVQGSGAGDGGSPGAVLTLNGNGRTIEGQDVQEFTAPFEKREWMYRADLGDWVVVAALAAGDEMPFPEEFDDLWVSLLAIRLAPRFDKVTAPETKTTAINMLSKLQNRYRQAAPTVYGSNEFPRGLQSFMSGQWFW